MRRESKVSPVVWEAERIVTEQSSNIGAIICTQHERKACVDVRFATEVRRTCFGICTVAGCDPLGLFENLFSLNVGPRCSSFYISSDVI